MRGQLVFGFWALVLLVTPLRGQEHYVLDFRLTVRVESPSLDSELLAGGRLELRAEETALSQGRWVLRLERILEDPWKLYWVDPWGPFGEEVKVASVIDLTGGSWAELKEGRQAAQRSGLVRYQQWIENREGRSPRFDGSFAFVVLGPVRGRFSIGVGSESDIPTVVNEMTTSWRSGEFAQWEGDGWKYPPGGYWFWNEGEGQPFDWEPHTYHALAAAAELLTLGRLPIAENQAETAARTALSVLQILAPKARRQMALSGFEGLISDPSEVPGAAIGRRFEIGDTGYVEWVVERTEGELESESVTVHLANEAVALSFEVSLGRLGSVDER